MKPLTELKQMDYEKLLPWFEQNKYSCAEIARQTNMGHAQVLSYFSRYLVQKKEELTVERCQTCGKLKNDNMNNTCRDVFHYL